MRRLRMRDERGANLVEFALVLPILAGLIFGIAEFGIAFNNHISLRQGTREGARLGSVMNVTATGSSGCTLSGGTALTPSDDAQRIYCETKDRIGLKQSNTKVRLRMNPSTGAKAGDTMTVCATYPLTSVTKLFSALLNGKTLRSKVEIRLEADPTFAEYNPDSVSDTDC